MSSESVVQAAANAGRGRSRGVARLVLQNAVIAAMVLTFVAFSLAKPESFFTMLTFKAILRDASPLLILALGITVVLVVNEFDLSVGGLAGLTSTLAVLGVSGAHFGLSVPLAVALTLVAGGLLASINGFLIAYLGASSFIVTLGMGTVFNGLEVQILGANTIYEEIPAAYGEIANGSFLGLSNQIFIALGVMLVIGVLLHQFELGRYLYAIGGNREATRLSGVRVRLVLLVAFVIAGVCAAIAGILVSAQAGSANPNAGIGFLLPAYAAAFLGSSMWRPGTFTVAGTVLGTLFLQIIGTGLTLFSISGALVSIIQGGILVAAVVISRLGRDG
ncbi:MAG: ABC transporter permease [Actinobacteria bacterium]|nr:ABC transporter permease [Actinomycetota bacterium]